MEFSLHQQLKAHYASAPEVGAAKVSTTAALRPAKKKSRAEASQQICESGQAAVNAAKEAAMEVVIDCYRIDVVRPHDFVEVQVSGLAAIRDKIQRLLQQHTVTVVKPIIARKWIVKLDRAGGAQQSRRLSPKKGKPLTLFEELVYFTQVFPHPRLTLETPLVAIEEIRYPGHGKRRRRRENDFRVEDQRLIEIEQSLVLRTTDDLWQLVSGQRAPGKRLPSTFGTQELADYLQVDRWEAQRVAYCLRKMGVLEQVGKQGNALQYQLTVKSRRTGRRSA